MISVQVAAAEIWLVLTRDRFYDHCLSTLTRQLPRSLSCMTSPVFDPVTGGKKVKKRRDADSCS